MSAIYYELQDYGDDFLMHYGRKGMKWYQHIFTTVRTGTERGARAVGTAGKTVGRATAKAAKATINFTTDITNSTIDDIKAYNRRRVDNAKEKAIATGNYKKIKKYQGIMTDDELRRAQSRMQQSNALRDLDRQSALSPSLQRKVNKAIEKENYKKLIKLEPKMSPKEMENALERLNSRTKLSELEETRKSEKKIRAMETVARVGKASYAIAELAYKKKELADKKEQLNENQRVREENQKVREENQRTRERNAAKSQNPFRKAYKSQLEEQAAKAGDEAASKVKGAAAKRRAWMRGYAQTVNEGQKYFDANVESRPGWDFEEDKNKKKK